MYGNNGNVGRGGGTGGTIKVDDRRQLVLWVCKTCGYRNWPNRFKCRSCLAKRMPDAAVIAEPWSAAVLPAEVREFAKGGPEQQSGGKGGKVGKGKRSEGAKGKGRRTGGGEEQQEPEPGQPTGRVPTRFRIDDDSEEGKGEEGRPNDQAVESSEEEGTAWTTMLKGGKKKKQVEKRKGETDAGDGDADMEGPKGTGPMQVPNQPRKLLVAQNRALHKKKEELQGGKGVGTIPGGTTTTPSKARGERRLRKVEEELERNERDLKAAGGANAGNLKVALWHEGKRIQRAQKRLAFLEVAIEEDEEAVEEAQRKYREHINERSEVREVLRKRKARHAHLATELAGEAQAEAEEVPGKLEWAMQNVEGAYATGDASHLDTEAIREILIFCRKIVPPQNEYDEEEVLGYLSLQSSSSDFPSSSSSSASSASYLTQAEGGEETPTGANGEEEENRVHTVLVEADVVQVGGTQPETAENMLEKVLATHKAETGTSKEDQKGALALTLPAKGSNNGKGWGEEQQVESAGKERREGSKPGKRRKATRHVEGEAMATEGCRGPAAGEQGGVRIAPLEGGGGQGVTTQVPLENCRACNDVLVGGVGQHSCECGAPVCEACDGCNQCLRCLQPPPIRSAQKALAVGVRNLRGRLSQNTGKGQKTDGRRHSNSRSPRRGRSM